MDPEMIKNIDRHGPCIYRINGAHVFPDDVAKITELIRSAIPDARIMLDLPGNKVRTKFDDGPVTLTKNETFELKSSDVNYPDFWRYLKVGDTLFANDSIYRLEVVSIADETVTLLSISDGVLETRKGLHARGVNEHLPFLFEHDELLIDAALEHNVDIISLSFVRNAEDVRIAKKRIGFPLPGVTIFAKIETAAALENLGYIFQEVDVVNIDRGDLSADIGILKIAVTQQRVIQAALRAKKQIFLATQFLKNMETQPIPLIAELMGLHEAINSGVSGIQLSEETAVGKFPEECVKLVFDMYKGSFIG